MADRKVVIFVLTQFFAGHIDQFLDALFAATHFCDRVVDAVFVAGDDRFDVQGASQDSRNFTDAAALHQILQGADAEEGSGLFHGCLCFRNDFLERKSRFDLFGSVKCHKS